jgi:DNA modification methylase
MIFHGDCLEKLREVEDRSVDMVLADLPYGTTACKWDTRIPFEPLWEQLHRVCKPNAAMCMFGSEPFSSLMRMSNLKRFKYDWVWDKKKVSGWLNAKKRPLVQHEIISVFYSEQPTYFPQMHSNKLKRDFRGVLKPFDITTTVGSQRRYISEVGPDRSYPRSIVEQTAVVGNSKEKVAHGTQKPVALLEYLIKTYTNEGDTVLDPTMGSGSTGVACNNLKRQFIGIEKELNYFEIAQKRIGSIQWQRK